jgi:hypothetical protein
MFNYIKVEKFLVLPVCEKGHPGTGGFQNTKQARPEKKTPLIYYK